MAATYRVNALGIPFAATGQILLGLYNGSVSGLIKIIRLRFENIQVTPLTGSQGTFNVVRYTAGTVTPGNWVIDIQSYDTANATPASGITCTSRMTVASPTTTDVFLRTSWSNDEPTQQTGTIDEFQVYYGWNQQIDFSYNDANITPIYIRPTQTFAILNNTFTATAPANAGIVDIRLEFTVE